jgi:hypothetical protein
MRLCVRMQHARTCPSVWVGLQVSEFDDKKPVDRKYENMLKQVGVGRVLPCANQNCAAIPCRSS